jgi:hypothetical protein
MMLVAFSHIILSPTNQPSYSTVPHWTSAIGTLVENVPDILAKILIVFFVMGMHRLCSFDCTGECRQRLMDRQVYDGPLIISLGDFFQPIFK